MALSFEGSTTDWATLEGQANQVARLLIGAGVAPRDRVAFLGKNSADFFLAMFGVAKAGACFVPLNWRLSEPELGDVLVDCGATIVIVERDHQDMLQGAESRSGTNLARIVIDEQATLVAAAADQGTQAPEVWISEDDAAIQLYTSGTTGRPKGVLLTHGCFNRIRLCEHLEAAYQWHPGDSFLFILPNFHLLGIGLSIQCLYNGLSLSVQRRFDPAGALAAITQDRPTLLVLTPTMIQMLLDHPDAATTDFGSLRLTMYAGSPISLGLIKRAIAAMPCQFMQFYGATESAGAISLLRPEEHDLSNEGKLKSCGRPLPLIALRIVDDKGNEVPDGQPGELLVRSPAIAQGYWNNPDATAAAFQDGWYRTGDVALRDAEGLYYIVDRAKDMIVTGGENVYSAEIEHVLSTHPAVLAVAVIGVPDERWGEAVKAVIVPKAGEEIALAELSAYCRERLAAYKVPKSFDLVDVLPMTGTGKVSKKDLRARYWGGQQRSVA
ncbi:long-chain-fatty-acid--CoA ligase [Oleomonas cavernae]|uniref:3-methylmercaptopropionyl-CoA ligase n=1 Tax=Oleomonas cavernae TaxID=2320859 RepID=A0A418WH94_9PROT|nr:long-chain-fatty-acid--CoA ligase [Oleomonas cavernae]